MILNAENLKCSFFSSHETVRNDLVLKIPQKPAVKYTPVFQLKDKYDWDGHDSLNLRNTVLR